MQNQFIQTLKYTVERKKEKENFVKSKERLGLRATLREKDKSEAQSFFVRVPTESS